MPKGRGWARMDVLRWTGMSWTGWPEQFDICCPRCDKCALFDEPFAFYRKGDAIAAGEHPIHRWGPSQVVERYPSVISWVSPEGRYWGLSFHSAPEGSGNYAVLKRGVVRCSRCHLVAVHELSWPRDAYWQWDIRGYILWAWSAAHARALREFLGSAERDAAAFPEFARSLRRLPKEVLSAKVRALIVKRISRSLDQADG